MTAKSFAIKYFDMIKVKNLGIYNTGFASYVGQVSRS
jgi:hypothetical protein